MGFVLYPCINKDSTGRLKEPYAWLLYLGFMSQLTALCVILENLCIQHHDISLFWSKHGAMGVLRSLIFPAVTRDRIKSDQFPNTFIYTNEKSSKLIISSFTAVGSGKASGINLLQ